MAANVLPSVATQRRAQPLVGHQELEALDELGLAFVIQAGVASPAVIDDNLTPAVGENRCAHGEGFQGEERQAFVRRRHDDDRRRLERVDPLQFRQPSGEADEGLLRQRHQFDAHERQRGLAAVAGVGAEVLDELLAAFARIDAAAVERDGPVETMASAEDFAAFLLTVAVPPVVRLGTSPGVT